MRIPATILMGTLITACSTTDHSSGETVRHDLEEAATIAAEDTGTEWEYDPEMDYAEYHVTIADTSHDFLRLETLMERLATALPGTIYMMGRRYHPERDSLLLPFDDEDEMYADSYFPRRFAGDEISIEYLGFYMTAAPGTFALVTGIWETPEQADSALRVLAPTVPSAFITRAELFQGCMH